MRKLLSMCLPVPTRTGLNLMLTYLRHNYIPHLFKDQTGSTIRTIYLRHTMACEIQILIHIAS